MLTSIENEWMLMSDIVCYTLTILIFRKELKYNMADICLTSNALVEVLSIGTEFGRPFLRPKNVRQCLQ